MMVYRLQSVTGLGGVSVNHEGIIMSELLTNPWLALQFGIACGVCLGVGFLLGNLAIILIMKGSNNGI